MNSLDKEYINTSTGNSNSELQSIVQEFLPKNSSLLLLGIGSGKDYEYLSQYFKVTVSDFSKLLITIFQQKHPKVELLNLDHVGLSTDRKFDSIFSNKVLSQMDEENLKLSLQNQLNILNKNGIAFHSFWSGDKEEDHHGLTWIYYTKEKLENLIPKQFEIFGIKTYKQNINNDSLCVILRKK